MVGWSREDARIATPAIGFPSRSTTEPSTRWSNGKSIITIGSSSVPAGRFGLESFGAAQAERVRPATGDQETPLADDIARDRHATAGVRREGPPRLIPRSHLDRDSRRVPSPRGRRRGRGSVPTSVFFAAAAALGIRIVADARRPPARSAAVAIRPVVARIVKVVNIRVMICLLTSAPAIAAIAAGAAAAIVPPAPITSTAVRAIAAVNCDDKAAVADAGSVAPEPIPTTAGAIPRRSRRRRSRSRPRDSRLCNVPTGQPSSPAACS